MEPTEARSEYKTQLKDRTLWFDGDSSFDPKTLVVCMQKYDVQFVDYIDALVEQYNSNCYSHEEIRIKSKCNPLELNWTIPEPYNSLDVESYLTTLLAESLKHCREGGREARTTRFFDELELYRAKGLFPILRVIIYVINMLTANGIVWGVGRGSSVSSYLLYLIGVHDVDSFAYQLDIHDFLHD